MRRRRPGPYLAGETFSNADAAPIPYVLRLELLQLRGFGKAVLGLPQERVRNRPSSWMRSHAHDRQPRRRSRASNRIPGRRSSELLAA